MNELVLKAVVQWPGSAGEKIRFQREKLGITVADFAENMAIHRKDVYNWENNLLPLPSLAMREQVAEELGLDYGYLYPEMSPEGVPEVAEYLRLLRSNPDFEETLAKQSLSEQTEVLRYLRYVLDSFVLDLEDAERLHELAQMIKNTKRKRREGTREKRKGSSKKKHKSSAKKKLSGGTQA